MKWHVEKSQYGNNVWYVISDDQQTIADVFTTKIEAKAFAFALNRAQEIFDRAQENTKISDMQKSRLGLL